MTLPEVLISTGLGGMLLTVMMGLSFYGAHSFAVMTNYVDLDQYGRNVLDRITSDIRQADRLTQFENTGCRRDELRQRIAVVDHGESPSCA